MAVVVALLDVAVLALWRPFVHVLRPPVEGTNDGR
jgi:hypothetical protein